MGDFDRFGKSGRYVIESKKWPKVSGSSRSPFLATFEICDSELTQTDFRR